MIKECYTFEISKTDHSIVFGDMYVDNFNVSQTLNNDGATALRQNSRNINRDEYGRYFCEDYRTLNSFYLGMMIGAISNFK